MPLRRSSLAVLLATVLLLAVHSEALAACVNVSSGVQVDCQDLGAVRESVYLEHGGELPAPASTDSDEGGGDAEAADEGSSGILLALVIFIGAFLVVGGVVLLVGYRRSGDSESSRWDFSWVPVISAVVAAAIVGVLVGSGLTLLIAERGPAGAQGEPGEKGAQGDRGPAFNPTGMRFRIDALQAQIDELNGSPPISDDVVDDLESLSDAVTELQDSTIDLCDEISFYCSFRRVSLASDGYGF